MIINKIILHFVYFADSTALCTDIASDRLLLKTAIGTGSLSVLRHDA